MALVAALLVAVGILNLSLREWWFSDWIDDDAFISFRYARNLAEGHGLVFNHGEIVEGYTNFLWTSVCAFCHKLGAEVPTMSQGMGAAVSLLTVLVLLAVPRRLPSLASSPDPARQLPVVDCIPALLICFCEPWAAWAVGGLENTLSAFLVLLSFVSYFSYLDRHGWLPIALSALFLCLAGMNHPTNVLFMGVIGLHFSFRALRDCGVRRQFFVFLALIVVVFGSYNLWRVSYFGELLPNTFHAKVGFTPHAPLRGLQYFGCVVLAFPVSYLCTIGIALVLLKRRGNSDPAWLLVASILLYTAYVIAVGGEEFPAYRCMVVLLPLFALTQLLLVRTMLATGRSVLLDRLRMRPLLAVLLLVGANALPLLCDDRVRRLDRAILEDDVGFYRAAAHALRQSLPPDTLFAHSAAGLLAFDTNFPWIDTLGLVDYQIARTRVANFGRGRAGHERGNGAYVLAREPDVIMFAGTPSSPVPTFLTGREIVALPEFSRDYQPVTIPFSFQRPSDATSRQYEIYFYKRKPTDGHTSQVKDERR